MSRRTSTNRWTQRLQWPAGRPRTPAAERKSANFGKCGTNEFGWKTTRSLSVADAIRRVTHEVQAFTPNGHEWIIDPDTTVISTAMPMRADGLPYSSAAEPDDPGVAVFFELDGLPHVLCCDKWNRVADNLAAIAKHLKALRGMERWGVGRLAEHFAGFKALPPASGAGAASDPVAIIAKWSRLTPAEVQADPKTASRKARVAVHPDRGGSEADAAAVGAAADLLIGGVE